jgi:hypothetical protein
MMKYKALLPIAMLGVAPMLLADNSPYLSRVYEFMPAPGQFNNVIPEYEDGDSYEKLLSQIEESICGGANPGAITLGAYGGYIVVGFDHPVVNVVGEPDFKIAGNATISAQYSEGGSCEPGIVMVSVDANGDGIPNDTWYELAGSDYYKDSTIHGYEITYYKPDENKVMEPDADDKNINDMTYIRWTSNDPSEPEGYVMRNIWHSQSYWPQWYEGDTMTFKGTLLADNAVNMGTPDSPYFLLVPCEWGYVDNLPNSDDIGLDISWAVDENGNEVKLAKIDFIKIYTGLNQYCGWLGETSTEVCGGTDLHPDAVADNSGVSAAGASASAISYRDGVIGVTAAADATPVTIYATSGAVLYHAILPAGTSRIDGAILPSGVAIVATPTASLKIMNR